MKGHFPGHFSRLGALVATLLLVAGCFGGGEAAPRAEATVAPTEAAEPTAAPTVEPTVVATDAESAESEPAESESAESENAESSDASATDASANNASGVVPLEDAPGINSYRMHATVRSTTARGEDNVESFVEIVGAYVKEPPAEQFLITMTEGDEVFEIEVVKVDGVSYTRINETWMQSSEGTISNIAEVTLLTPQNIVGIVEQMEVIGTETVNGVEATHYRGSKEIIPVVGTAGDTLDVSRVETAQLDLWADTTHNGIVKLSLEAGNSEPEMTASIIFDFTDLNSEITIDAPETLPASEEPPAEGDFEPRNELGALLGFNLLFPTGSTVETVVGANLYVVVGPYTLDEATNMIELNMVANGYTQLSKTDGPSGETVYLFQQGDKVVSISLSDAGDGSTRFQFATGA